MMSDWIENRQPLNPLVSVAMATFNGEKYLGQQLDSLLDQDYPEIEIVICDDSSTDGTVPLLKKYARNSNILLHLNDKNLGYVRNFEKTLSRCRGDYIALCDQDDVWLPQKISRLVSLARQTDRGLVYSDADLIDGSGQALRKSLRTSYNINYVEDNRRAFYLFNCVTGCTSLVSRRLLDLALPFPPGVIVHDWWLAFVAARLGRMGYTNERLIQYRTHGTNQIGIRPLTSLKTAGNIGLFLSSAKNRKEVKEVQGVWKKRYHDYFLGCLAFEQANGLETDLTEKLLEWSDEGSTWSWWGKSKLFLRQRDLFQIVPGHLRVPALLSRLFL
ncbi:MAG: glycosyltransferase family 2 protein [Desulfuromonas sp.]|nr:MAG: glycosyltransferase family 2 protein [Desulfuromonas sp.]